MEGRVLRGPERLRKPSFYSKGWSLILRDTEGAKRTERSQCEVPSVTEREAKILSDLSKDGGTKT